VAVAQSNISRISTNMFSTLSRELDTRVTEEEQ